MKRIVFYLVIIMSFVIASGCCSTEPNRQIPTGPDNDESITKDELIQKIEDLKTENDTLKGIIADLKASNGGLTPITLEIVNQANKAGGSTLRNLGYYLSAPLMLVTNSPNTEVSEQNGVLVIKDTNSNKLNDIQSSAKGKFMSYSASPMDKESFEISFPSGPAGSEDIKLKFERDKVKNHFVLVSVLAPKNVSFRSDGTQPYLCILLDYENEKNNPLYRDISSAAPETSPNSSNIPIIYQYYPLPLEKNPSIVQQLPSRYIMGGGILAKDIIVRYIQSKNRNMSWELIDAVVYTYIVEARKENINHDIAIAQMCEGTAYLNKLEVFNTHNYGDLQNIRGAVNKFSSMQLGVRAHIQQLKGYASLYGPTAERKVDTVRFNGIGRNAGKVTTLDELFPLWVTKNLNNYKNVINTILAEMYILQLRQ
jgi:hypothetical protein